LDLDAKMQKHDFLKQNTNELGRGIFPNPDLDLLASSLDLTLTCYPRPLGCTLTYILTATSYHYWYS